jgi:replicative DNA helicase
MIEENIIGLSIKGEIDPLTTGLKPENFSTVYYQKAWRTIIDIRSRNSIADLLTVSGKLESVDPTFNWLAMLGDCAQHTMPVKSAEGHTEEIKKQWVNRQIKNIGHDIVSASEPDLNEFIKQLMQLNQTSKKYLHSYSDAAEDALEEVEQVLNGDSKTIPTGFHDIDKITGGLHGSDLIVVAARSAMGKTAFLLNMAAANKNGPLVFSTEQSRIQAMWRNFSIIGGVPNHLIRTGQLDDEQFGRMSLAIQDIRNCNGWVYDKSGPYIDEIEVTAREVYQNHGCSAIYLDYLQRIKHRNNRMPRHEQVGDVAMRLKELARELNIPVVALAQVNRSVESRENKRPGMGDIKDSGMIEQEADSILTLYRDEVYNENTPDRGICEVDFKKNRHGGTGCIRLQWNAPTMKFNNLTKMQY